MAMTTTAVCRLCIVAFLVATPGHGAPRSKGTSYRSSVPQTVFDQKQTGDYNIQLHLKDFQIIALLGDEALSGDYDYNYDYADFTLKPSTNKPTTTSSVPSKPPPSTTTAPSSTSQPVTSNATEPQKEPSPTDPEKPVQPIKEEPSSIGSEPSSNATKVVEIVESSTAPHRSETETEETNSPGKIKVQIIETPVGIVPGEIPDRGEVLHVKRCATGFTRDKKGRCRRLRRPTNGSPQLPYGFSRLANNLASRFRYASSDESVPSSESGED